MERKGEMNTQKSCRNDQGGGISNNSTHTGNIIRENQERGSFRSIYEEDNADWQDRSTGSMGSQTSGGMTSKKINAEETGDSADLQQSAQESKCWNRYGQSPEDIQHAKDNEQMIRKGYSETQETDTNPYLRNMYENSTAAGIYPQDHRATEEGLDEEIGGPMDAVKNY